MKRRTPKIPSAVPPRFADHGEPLASFGERVLVRCPSCAGCAVVERRPSQHMLAARVRCPRCGYLRQADAAESIWQGPALLYARQRCARCGRWLEQRRRVQQAAGAAQQIALSCAGCQHTTQARPELLPAGDGAPRDPLAGLPLWLQTPCGNEVLWAYDDQHLAFLRSYVAATLRRRLPYHNQSLASRLPAWITRGHNRAGVLRGLRRLEELLAAARDEA